MCGDALTELKNLKNQSNRLGALMCETGDTANMTDEKIEEWGAAAIHAVGPLRRQGQDHGDENLRGEVAAFQVDGLFSPGWSEGWRAERPPTATARGAAPGGRKGGEATGTPKTEEELPLFLHAPASRDLRTGLRGVRAARGGNEHGDDCHGDCCDL